MNANATPPADVQNAPAAAPAAQHRSTRGRLLPWLALAVLAAATGWGYRELDRANASLRERLSQLTRDTAPAIEQARQATQDAQRQLAELKQTVVAMEADRAALERLSGDVLRMRDEAALIDVERLVTLAAAELQISGHVSTALAALQAADARLAAIERPQYVPLRRALTRDIERLRAVPQIDSTAIALKLDEMVRAVDGWPLVSDAKPPKPAAKSAPAPLPEGFWPRLRAWVAQEFGDVIRIHEVDTPDALLLSTGQQQLVRERLKLRLLSARQALLARNDRLFRDDLADAQALLVRYFDVRGTGAAAALAQARQLAQTTVTVDLPSINESLAALRPLRAGAPAARAR